MSNVCTEQLILIQNEHSSLSDNIALWNNYLKNQIYDHWFNYVDSVIFKLKYIQNDTSENVKVQKCTVQFCILVHVSKTLCFAKSLPYSTKANAVYHRSC